MKKVVNILTKERKKEAKKERKLVFLLIFILSTFFRTRLSYETQSLGKMSNILEKK